jgi:hypothetical protein
MTMWMMTSGVTSSDDATVSLSTSKSTHSKARAIVVLLFWDTAGARKRQCAAFCIESDKRQPHVPGKCWR